MASEDMDFTLENLLDLALGNPEIGAVNFNFLHEVISEILKHLGISNKSARVTQELDFRLALQDVAEEHRSQSPVQRKLPPSSRKTAPNNATLSGHAIGSKGDHAEPINQVQQPIAPGGQPMLSQSPPPPYKPSENDFDGPSQSQPHGQTNPQGQAQSQPQGQANPQPQSYDQPQSQGQAQPQLQGQGQGQAQPKPLSAQGRPIPTSSVTPPLEDPRPLSGHANNQQQRQPSMTDARAEAAESSRSRQHIPAPPSSHSRKTSFHNSRRSSLINQRLSSLKGNPSFNDTIVRGTLERGNSQTPAGDMWHVLNINRRVEAAEAAIQGMTNLIDNINTDLYEMRSNNSSDVIRTQSPSFGKNLNDMSDGGEWAQAMTNMMNDLDSKMSDFNEQVSKLATKDQIEDFRSADYINDMIKEKLETLDITKRVSKTHAPAGLSAGSEKDSGLEDALVSKAETGISVTDAVKSVSSLKRRDSRDSRTRIAYQEVSAKMLYLEQEINKAKGHVNSLEVMLGAKIELSDIESKLDKTDFWKVRDELNKQIKNALDQISALESSHRTVGEEVSALVSQTDEFTVQQRHLAKAMKKLERDLEDMTDNFHRSQTDMAQKRSNNGLDEAAINKIRGNIFDIQEQQSKFQQNLDSLEQDSKNKDKFLENINIEIKELQEVKVDKDYVQQQLAGKVDQGSIINKVERDHFDACVRDLDENIQNILQKIDGTEAFTNQKMTTLEGIIGTKVDHDDLKEIHAYIDQRFKTFKPKVQQKQRAEETAAGTKKQLIKNCNCISCDRPVEMTTGGDEIVTLPYYQALPGVKSMRPINTFDLQTLRQHMHQTLTQGSNRQRFELSQERSRLQKELLQLCGVRDLDEFAVSATNRACGGEHTLIEQNRRNPTKNPNGAREDGCYGERQLETEVRGRDGHIYKGRLQSAHLPDIR
eukprot:TCONS_00061998-protein